MIKPDFKLRCAEITNISGETILHLAAREKNIELMQHILQSIPRINRKFFLLKSSNFGLNAFHLITQTIFDKKNIANKVLSVLQANEIFEIESDICNYGWNYDYKESAPYDYSGYIDCPEEYKYFSE